MKFSVVTISFNQAEFLERTIKSVISQSGAEFEYIMVDPGSTDGSREIIGRYRRHFARVILDRDQGPADGLNRGFALATGDVYCYLNSDDTFEAHAFRRVAAFFDAHPELDVICGHAYATDRHDRRLRRIWSEPFRPLAVAYGAAVQIQPSTFIRREAFWRSGGFNISNRDSWDWELLIALHLSGARIGIIDAFLSTYRLHRLSITNSGRLRDRIAASRARNFQRLLGRPQRFFDPVVGLWFRAAKHASSPAATLERILHGPVSGRGVD